MPATRIKGIEQIKDDFDLFLLDMWGVMHDGSKAYDGVLDTVKKLKEANKKIAILSNSSKRKENSVKMLRKLGFDPEDFEEIITSGEVAFNILSGNVPSGCDGWNVIEDLRSKGLTKVFVFGSGDGDIEYCQKAGWDVVPLEEASLVIARGTFTIVDGSSQVIDKNVDSDLYEKTLKEKMELASQKKLPMLVCNPDKVRPDVGLPPMPGRIGADYCQLLGGGVEAERLVKCIGKPFPDVYKIAMSVAHVDVSRTCMVGDALETDVCGGSETGIHTVWVLNDGIHGPDLGDASLEDGAAAVLETFNARRDTYAKSKVLSPSYITEHFRW